MLQQLVEFIDARVCDLLELLLGAMLVVGSGLSGLLELAETIWRKIKGPDEPLRVVSDDPFEYDVQRRVPATEKAKRVLGFEAATTLDEMLDEVIPWIAAATENGTI